jgi:hypothetical protein
MIPAKAMSVGHMTGNLFDNLRKSNAKKATISAI